MAPPKFQNLLCELDGDVMVLTLNRPDVLNALNSEMVADIRNALAHAAGDSRCRALLVTGSGRGFCSGADLAAGGSGMAPSGVGVTERVQRSMESHWNPMMEALQNFPKPVVSCVNGVAAGGGMGIALAADVVVAAPQAYFVSTFGQKLGLVPDLGVTWQLARRLPRGAVLPFALLGEPLSAEEAERRGLIWRVVRPPQKPLTEALAIARKLAACSRAAMVETRKLLDGAVRSAYEEQLRAEGAKQGEVWISPERARHMAHIGAFGDAARRRSQRGPAKL